MLHPKRLRNDGNLPRLFLLLSVIENVNAGMEISDEFTHEPEIVEIDDITLQHDTTTT